MFCNRNSHKCGRSIKPPGELPEKGTQEFPLWNRQSPVAASGVTAAWHWIPGPEISCASGVARNEKKKKKKKKRKKEKGKKEKKGLDLWLPGVGLGEGGHGMKVFKTASYGSSHLGSSQ